jgi:hypothetical protein
VSDLRARLPLHAGLTLVLLVVVVGLVRVATQHWRQGALLIGAGLLVAALLRAVLPDDRIGLLAVRSRVIDVVCYAVFGAVMIFVAWTIAGLNQAG